MEDEKTVYFWHVGHGGIIYVNPLVYDDRDLAVDPLMSYFDNEYYEDYEGDDQIIEFEILNIADMCWASFGNPIFDPSKFKKYLNIQAKGLMIESIKMYKDDIEYIMYDRTLGIVNNIPNIKFGYEQAKYNKLYNIEDNFGIKDVYYDGVNYTLGNEFKNIIEDDEKSKYENQGLFLHHINFKISDHTYSSYYGLSLLEKLYSLVPNNNSKKLKIVLFNNSCLTVSNTLEMPIRYPEWSKIFSKPLMTGPMASFQNSIIRIKGYDEDINENDKKLEKLNKHIKYGDKGITLYSTLINEINAEIKELKLNENESKKYMKEKSKYITEIEKLTKGQKLLKKMQTQLIEKNTHFDLLFQDELSDMTKDLKASKTQKVRRSLGDPKVYFDKTRSKRSITKKRTKSRKKTNKKTGGKRKKQKKRYKKKYKSKK